MLRFVNTRCNFKNYQIVCVPIGCSVIFLLGPKEKKSSVTSLKARVLFDSHVYKQSAFLHSLT